MHRSDERSCDDIFIHALQKSGVRVMVIMISSIIDVLNSSRHVPCVIKHEFRMQSMVCSRAQIRDGPCALPLRLGLGRSARAELNSEFWDTVNVRVGCFTHSTEYSTKYGIPHAYPYTQPYTVTDPRLLQSYTAHRTRDA